MAHHNDMLDRSFFARPPLDVAPELLGGIVVAVIAILFHVFNPSPAGIMSAVMLLVAFVLVNAITLPYSMLVDVLLVGALFIFYKWFWSGFFSNGSFSVFRKGWDTTIPGWKPWRWRIKKNDLGWKALLAERYHSSKQRGIIHSKIR